MVYAICVLLAYIGVLLLHVRITELEKDVKALQEKTRYML